MQLKRAMGNQEYGGWKARGTGSPSRYIQNATYLALSVSLIEIITGISMNIIVLEADGLHTSIDSIILFSLYIGFSMASKPADTDHPYGHSKYKYLAMYTVAIVIIVATFILIYEAIMDIIRNQIEKPPIVSLYIVGIILALVVSRMVYLLIGHRRLSEPVLMLEAKHAAADIADSLMIVGTIVLSMYIPLIEPVAALAISSYLLYLASNYIKESVNTLLDRVDPSLAHKIISTLGDSGIIVSDVKLKNLGNGYAVDIVIKVPHSYSIEEAHNAANNVETNIRKQFTTIRSVTVHMEPLQ